MWSGRYLLCYPIHFLIPCINNMVAFCSRLLPTNYAALFEEKDFAEASLLSVQVRVHLLVESQSPRQFENHIPSLFLLDPSLLVAALIRRSS